MLITRVNFRKPQLVYLGFHKKKYGFLKFTLIKTNTPCVEKKYVEITATF